MSRRFVNRFLLLATAALVLAMPRRSATAPPVSSIVDLGTLGGDYSDASA